MFASVQALERMFQAKEGTIRPVKRINYPLGLLHIGSVLEKNAVQTNIIDLDRYLFYYMHRDRPQERSLDNFLETYLVKNIRKYQPDVIGISGNFNTVAKLIQRCCERIKEENPNIINVVGGHYFTNSYKEILSTDQGADYVILGEAEEVMMGLVRVLKEGKSFSLNDHPHIVTKDNVRNGQLQGKRVAMVMDLESLPPINYSLLEEEEDYLSSAQDMHTILPREVSIRAIALMTSRGCPHSCTYCASHKVHGKKMRAFSVDRVMRELEDLVGKYDINTLVFEDDLFTYSRKRTIEFCQKVCDRFGDRFVFDFPNGIAVRTLDDEVVYWLAKAGMKQINLAVESGNQYVQDVVIKKRVKLEWVKPVVDILKKYDVLVRAYFIIGFPGETLDMMRDTKNFAKALKLDWSVFSFATPIVGSELYEKALRDNHLVTDDMDVSTYFDFRLKTADWGPDEVIRVQEEANYEVNFLENYNLVEGNYPKSKLIFEDIVKDYPQHVIANYCLWKSLRGLGDEKGAALIERRMRELVETDENSLNIIKRYRLLSEQPFSYLSAVK